MKKFYLFLLAFFTLSVVSAQNWQWQNPLPQGNHLYSVKFVDSNTGYAVGCLGTILKTTNGGALWISQVSGTFNDLTSVFFTDVNTGYVVGQNSIQVQA